MRNLKKTVSKVLAAFFLALMISTPALAHDRDRDDFRGPRYYSFDGDHWRHHYRPYYGHRHHGYYAERRYYRPYFERYSTLYGPYDPWYYDSYSSYAPYPLFFPGFNIHLRF